MSVSAQNYAYDALPSSQTALPSYLLPTENEHEFGSGAANGWEYQAELDLSSLPYSPESDLPCPRISRFAASAPSSQSLAPLPLPHTQAPQVGRGEFAYDYSPSYSHYSLPRYASTVSSPSPDHSWTGHAGASARIGAGSSTPGNHSHSYGHEHTGRSGFDLFGQDPSATGSGSGYYTSRPVSPQSSSFSDSAEYTRPRQRRKLARGSQRQSAHGGHESSTPFLSTGMSSDFVTSDTGNASDSSFMGPPVKKGRGSKSGRGGKKARGSKVRSISSIA